jgi:hypothetical protein
LGINGDAVNLRQCGLPGQESHSANQCQKTNSLNHFLLSFFYCSLQRVQEGQLRGQCERHAEFLYALDLVEVQTREEI